jgi:thioredoxin 1
MLDTTQEDFSRDVIDASQDSPVLVDFWAPWCGPCKAIGPLVEKLAESYGDRILFAKCNADDSQEATAKYGIKSIPTLMFFNDGNVFDKITGLTNQAKIEEVLKKILAGEQGASPFIVR